MKIPLSEAMHAGRCEGCGRMRSPWTPQEICDAAVRWAETNGRTPFLRDWLFSTPEHPNYAMVQTTFLTWNAMLAAAGLQTRRSGGGRPRWTKDLVAQAMLDELLRTGVWPTTRTWGLGATTWRPSRHTVLRLFGTWTAAKTYAGWDPAAASRPVPAETHCRGCGAEFSVVTAGCKNCHDRKRKRDKWHSDATYRERQKTARTERRRRQKNGSTALPAGSSLRVPRSSADGESASGGGAVTSSDERRAA